MIRIRSLKDGFRRCGTAHPSVWTEYRDDFFATEQWERLRAEPMLQVETAPAVPTPPLLPIHNPQPTHRRERPHAEAQRKEPTLMAYCTIDDLRDQVDASRLIQLTDDEGTGTVDTARVNRAIGDAGEEIDAYVGARHAVPLDPVPAMVRKAAVDIAVYNLYGRREKTPEIGRNATGTRSGTRTGVAGQSFPGRTGPEGTPPASDAPVMSGENPRRAFTRNTLTGF